jgi:hypothetical protein
VAGFYIGEKIFNSFGCFFGVQLNGDLAVIGGEDNAHDIPWVE